MLLSIKHDICMERYNVVLEEMTDYFDGMDIRDSFLDDVDTVTMGAEDDPEIEKLIEKIPEYDSDSATEEMIDKLTESYIPEFITEGEDV